MSNTQVIKKIYCNQCKGITRHVSKGKYVRNWDSPDADIQGMEEYHLLICAGCETGSLEITESNSEDYTDDGSTLYRKEYFPKREPEGLTPKHFKKLGGTLEQIYLETIHSFNSGSLILATAGLRALLEGVCEDKKISGPNLSKKIDNLRTLLPNENIIRALHHFRFTGNDAVHRLTAPKTEKVQIAISVMEELLSYLYELEYKIYRLTGKGAGDTDE